MAELAKAEPALERVENDFKKNILVAAFLGERNTGGYSIDMSRTKAGDIQIQEKKPGKGVMVPQMITSPFKVVSIPSHPATAVRVKSDSAWSWQNYNVKKGTFTVSGGFAGRSKQFELMGAARMMQYKRLATFSITLRKKGDGDKLLLADLATGTIDSEAIKISTLSAGDLIPPPTNGLSAEGKLTNNAQSLSLTFVSLPTMIADGYHGRGMIEAIKVVPTR